MTKVFIGPAAYQLSNSRYGKTYNIVENVQRDDVNIQLLVGEIDDELNNSNVQVETTHSPTNTRYYLASFKRAWKALQSDAIDVYHHMNLSYRWFNPALIADRSDTPVLIGPAQAPHTLPKEEFKLKVEWIIGKERSELAKNIAYEFASTGKSSINPIREKLFAKTLQRADKITVVNEETKQLYSNFVDEEKLTVIPIGVDTTFFNYNGHRESRKLVAVGRLMRRKGYRYLLEALPEVVGEFPETNLHILGDGPLREQLERKATELNIADAVTFHGYVQQDTVRYHLKTARAFVHPSLSESFSPIRLEAMSTGCPIIATNIVGAQEMIRDGNNGFVIPNRSSEAIRNAVFQLLTDKELANSMGRNARQRVEENYRWSKIGEAYLDVYRSLST